MQVFPKGTPRAAPLVVAVEEQHETGTKKTHASAASASSKEASSAKKKKERKKTRSNDKDRAERREDKDRVERREDQSSSKRSDRKQRRHEEKKKKKKERIPIIDRVPTAMDYDSDDSLERMIRQRSRYSRYMTEYDVKPDNFDDASDDGDEEDIVQDKYNGIARLWSDSDDSDHAEWRSWDDNEETTPANAPNGRKSQFDRAMDRLVANEDDISAILQERSKKNGQNSKVSRGASSRALDEGLSPNARMDDRNWEHIDYHSGGAIEAVLDPLKANGLAEDMDQIIRPSSSDTSSLTDPLKREEMLIAARIRAANENDYMTQHEVPRMLSLTKKRSKATASTQQSRSVSSAMDSPNETRTGIASPPLKEAHDGSATNADASKSKTDATGKEDNTKEKEIPKVDTLPTISSAGQSSVSKSTKQKLPERGGAVQPEGTIEIAEASAEVVPKAENADAAEEEPKQSRWSLFSRVPLFRSVSRTRSRSRSREKRNTTPTGRKERPTPEPEPERDNGEAVTKQKSVSIADKYTPTEEKKTFVDEGAPSPQGGDEKGSSGGDKTGSPRGDVKASSHLDVNATSNNDVKPSTHLDGNGKPNEAETREPQEKSSEEVDNLLTVTSRDKHGPAWCDSNKAVTEAERDIMYNRALVNDSYSGSAMGRALAGNRVKDRNFVHKAATKAKKAQMMELDEYSFAVSVDEDPDLVQCLRFYYCGAIANVFGVAIAATDCTKTKKQIKGSEVKTGILSSIDEVDEVEAQRWRDENASPSPKVEVFLEELSKKSRPVDHVAIDHKQVERQQKHQKKNTSKGRSPRGRNQYDEALDDETADFEIDRQISRVQEVTSMHFSLDEDSEKKRKQEAMLRARRMAAQPIKEIPITSIRIPSQSVETNKEPNPAVEEKGRDRGEGRTESPSRADNASPVPSDDDDDKIKKVDDDVTMGTSSGSSEESAGSGTEPPKKKGLTRFLPRVGRKATKEGAN